jgi:hypothetical protein
MDDSELIHNMKLVHASLKRLNDLSQEQLRILASDDLSNLHATFEERQALFEYVQTYWETIQNDLKVTRQCNTTPDVSTLHEEIMSYSMQFIRNDEEVSSHITHLLEKSQTNLVELYKAKIGAKDYQTIERVTDAVARIFPGNSRHFDEQS